MALAGGGGGDAGGDDVGRGVRSLVSWWRRVLAEGDIGGVR